jgi:putative transcriptional regulator
MTSIQGKALVASPYLMDPNFMRTVVYVFRHDEEGAFGLILNRPTKMTVEDLLAQLEQAVETEAPVFCGGPVDGPLMVIHERADFAELPSEDGIYLTTDQSHIIQLCQADEGRFRVFDGYSGWSSGQLDSELEGGGWLVWDIDRDSIFSDEEEIWEHAVRKIGRDILAAKIDPARIPDDPAYN